MRRVIIASALLAAGWWGWLGCASPGAPPGGPPDRAAPEIVQTVPDSTKNTHITPPAVVFQFNEVVSEIPAMVKGGTLASLFLISPRDGAPVVDWSREEVSVRPRKGWRKNTVYTVTMLPGLTDLRGNIRKDPLKIVFSTGDSIPKTRLSGRVFNWVTGLPIPVAFVEATQFLSAADSVTFITFADSAGTFVFEHMPVGAYRLRGFMDENSNRGFDIKEIWDTLTVTVSNAGVVDIVKDSVPRTELLAFTHDTIGPKIVDVWSQDSVNVRVIFDQPIDVDQRITPDLFRLISNTKDSTNFTIERVTAPPADSTSRKVTVLPTRRPVPQTVVILRLLQPLTPGEAYRVHAKGVRGLLGRTVPSERAFIVPKPKPVTPTTPVDTITTSKTTQ